MRRYESVVILDPELAEDDVKSLSERFRRLVREFGGEIIKIEDWGLRRLAYLVKRKERGRYVFFDYVGAPALLAEMERQFKIADEVMKYLSVKLDDDVDLEAFRAQAKEREAAAQSAALSEAATNVSEIGPDVAEPTESAMPETESPSTPIEPAPVAPDSSAIATPPAPEPLESEPTPQEAPLAQAEAAAPVQPDATEQPTEPPTPTGGES